MRLLMVGGQGRLARRLIARLLGEHELLVLDADAPVGAAPVAGDPADPNVVLAAAEGAQILVIDGRGLWEARGAAGLEGATAALVQVARRGDLRIVALSSARTRTLSAEILSDSPALVALREMERALLEADLPLTLLCPGPLLGPGAWGAAVERMARPASGPVAPKCRFSFVDVRDVEGAMVSALFRPPAGRLELGAPPVSLRAFDRRCAAWPLAPVPPAASDEPALGLGDEIIDAGAASAALGFWTRPRARTLRETAQWLGRGVDGSGS